MKPDRIIVEASRFAMFDMSEQIPALCVRANLFVNPDAMHWTDPTGNSEFQHRVNEWSTDHPLHPLFHEAGHFSHYKADPNLMESWSEDDITPRQKTLAATEISNYALRSLHEFMAEVYASLIVGAPVSGGIMRAYRGKGGIEP